MFEYNFRVKNSWGVLEACFLGLGSQRRIVQLQGPLSQEVAHFIFVLLIHLLLFEDRDGKVMDFESSSNGKVESTDNDS